MKEAKTSSNQKVQDKIKAPAHVQSPAKKAEPKIKEAPKSSSIIKPEIILAYTLENAVSHEGKAQSGSVIPKLFQVGLKKEHVKDVIKDVQDAVNKVNKMKPEEQAKEFDNLSRLLCCVKTTPLTTADLQILTRY